MKKYLVYLTDHPFQALEVNARNLTECKKQVRLYIRQWRLDADIDRIEEVAQ